MKDFASIGLSRIQNCSCDQGPSITRGASFGARSFFPADPTLVIGGVLDTIQEKSAAFSQKFSPFGEVLALGLGALGTYLTLDHLGRIAPAPKTASDRSRRRR